MKYIICIMISVLFIFCAGCSNIATQSSGSGKSSIDSQSSISLPTAWPKLSLINAYPKITFNQPLEYLTTPGDDNLVYVVGKTGLVYVFDNDPGASAAEIFLDISVLVDSLSSEKGLLGMAFHPEYKSNGYFYVNYTDSNNTVIARYQADPKNIRRGLVGSAKVILTIPQPFSNHNGGRLDFGPDGYLYIGMGDGGSRGDPNGNAQNLKSLLGKILRIDVDKVKTGLNYGIPPDNPFIGNKNGYREEIYAYGFRNPWKFSFDKIDGFLWVADVGQNAVEEVDIVNKGLNYGWNKMEGSLCYPSLEKCNLPGMQKPIWEYRHPSGQSITGGYVYSGSRIADLYGTYIYGDYVSGLVWGLRYRNNIAQNHMLLTTGLHISSFGIDKNNEIYILDLEGRIYKFK
ncbi:MAG: PQQ-dependent sugar dehydrogenase [Saccharofermentanales bacterium]